MKEFESPTYVLELHNKSNRSKIASAKPGKEVQVLVHLEEDSLVPPISAKGIRSADGASFLVIVTTAAGVQTHDWGYQDLLEAINCQQ